MDHPNQKELKPVVVEIGSRGLTLKPAETSIVDREGHGDYRIWSDSDLTPEPCAVCAG